MRSHGTVRSLLAGLFAAVALLGLAAVTGPAARADHTDDAFLAAITAKGINFGSPQTALTAAHEVCDELGHGRSTAEIAAEVMQNSDLSGYLAGYFVGASIAAYCPNYAS